jgi:hypothetical protein
MWPRGALNSRPAAPCVSRAAPLSVKCLRPKRAAAHAAALRRRPYARCSCKCTLKRHALRALSVCAITSLLCIVASAQQIAAASGTFALFGSSDVQVDNATA